MPFEQVFHAALQLVIGEDIRDGGVGSADSTGMGQSGAVSRRIAQFYACSNFQCG